MTTAPPASQPGGRWERSAARLREQLTKVRDGIRKLFRPRSDEDREFSDRVAAHFRRWAPLLLAIAVGVMLKISERTPPTPPRPRTREPRPLQSYEQLRARESALTPAGAQAVVIVTLHNSYNSADSLKEVQAFLELVPPTSANLPPGGTLSDTILERYGFGFRDRPLHYALLENTILHANGWTSPQAAQPGPIRVPALPSLGIDSGRAGALSVRTTSLPTGAFATSMAPPPPPPAMSPIVPDTTRVRLDLPANRLADFIGSNPQAADVLLAPNSATILSRPMLVISNADPTCTGGDSDAAFTWFLTNDQEHQLAQLLAQATHNVYLFILEGTWPTAGTYSSSRSSLTTLLRAFCDKNHLQPLAPDLESPPSAFTGGHKHASQVYESVAGLIPQSTRVKVVFVPLTKHQAVDVLTAILTIGAAWNAMQEASPGAPKGISDEGMAAIIRKARADGPTLLSTVADYPDPSGDYVTNPAVIESLYAIASNVFEEHADVFVFNESWTAPTNRFLMKQPPRPRGLVVAAVGDDGVSVDDVGREKSYATFAKRASSYLAVMSLDAKGKPYCATSCVNYLHPDMNAVGFNGSVAAACGSSFASPRVAWFIAARASRRAGSFPADASIWMADIKSDLKSVRNTINVGPPYSLLFDPIAYVGR